MSGLLGGGGSKRNQTKPQYTGLQVQTSAAGLAIPLIYGTAKIAPNLIWYGDFQSIGHKEKQGGKGGGGQSSTTYTYKTAVILALGEGVVANVLRAWADKTVTSPAALGLGLFNGAVGQTPWGYLSAKHPDQALAYPATAYLASGAYDLGQSPNLPNHNFEAVGLLAGTGGAADADPAAVILDFLTDPNHGAGFPASGIDLVSLMSGPGSLHNYCQGLDIRFSVAMTDQRPARDVLDDWLKLTNCAAVWSGDQLKFIPYGDAPVGSYLPNLTPVYDLSDDDFVAEEGTDPVEVMRSDPADASNVIKLEIVDRANAYNVNIIETKDQAALEQFGPRNEATITAHEICDPSVGAVVSQLIKDRTLYVRNLYRFKLSWEYCLLEPMDLVTLTDPALGMNKVTVRIRSIAEGDDGLLEIEAEEFPAGIATATAYPKQARLPFVPNYAVSPGAVNRPVIIEPPADLLNGPAQIWVAVSGADPNWGGCSVWLSGDGTTYEPIGRVENAARHGVLNSALPAFTGSGIDGVSAPVVDISASQGQLYATTVQTNRTLTWIDGEYLSYMGAQLVGTGLYKLSGLQRGLYGSTAGAHQAGSLMARLDDQIFKYALPAASVGQQIWLKFTSFNIYGGAEQSLADVVAYGLTPVGTGYFIAAPGPVTVTPAPRTQADGTSLLALVVGWQASVGPMLGAYEVQWQIQGVNGWSSASVSAGVTQFAILPASENTVYAVRVRAVSAAPVYNLSAWSLAAPINSGALSTTIPAPPSNLAAMGGTRAIQLSWVDSVSPDVKGYRISSAIGSNAPFAGAAVICASVKATSFTHQPLGFGEARSYWVQTIGTGGLSPPAGPVYAVTDSTIPIAALGAQVVSESLLVPSLRAPPGKSPNDLAAMVDAQAAALSKALLAQVNQASGMGQALAVQAQSLQSYTDQAVASATSGLVASVAGVNALVVTETMARVTGDSALSSQITSLTTTVNNNAATANSALSAQSTSLTAVASQVTSLTSTVNGNTASIQQQVASINGLSAQYTVKINANGTVSGFGLASDLVNGTPVSEFAVAADRFLIVPPGTAKGGAGTVAPFAVVNGQVLIQSAVIGTISANQIGAGTISGATINIRPTGPGQGLNVYDTSGNLLLGAGGFGNAIVGTGQLKLGSATNLSGAVSSGTIVGNNVFVTTMTLTFSLADVANVLIGASWSHTYSGDNQAGWQIQIIIDGQIFFTRTVTNVSDSPNFQKFTALSAGSHTIIFNWLGTNGKIQFSNGSLTALASMR